MTMSDTEYEQRLKTTGRNDRCPCGSGKKYKKCHLAEDEGKRTAALQALEEEAKARAAAKAEEEDADAKTTGKKPDKIIRKAGPKNNPGANKGDVGGNKNVPRRGAI